MQLKVEHQGIHATFLDLDITIKDGQFIYKLFDKRDDFPFFIVRMPDKGGNIPSFVFYGSVLSEFLRVARTTMTFTDYHSRAHNLFVRMCNQGGTKGELAKQLRKAYLKHPAIFSKYHKTPEQLVEEVCN